MHTRVRRLTDLFVVGRAVELPDGGHLWVQALNAFQRDEAINDAAIARARLILALQEDGQERMKIRARFVDLGRDKMASDLAEARAGNKVGTFLDELRDEPDWKERLAILLNTDDDHTATPLSVEEVTLLGKINKELMDELAKRQTDEAAYQRRHLQALSDDDLIEVWTDDWVERRGNAIATAEYQQTEITYAARFCEATTGEDDQLDHAACNGHTERIFAARGDVREAPNDLVLLITETLTDLNVSGRDPKDSASPASSSGSPPAPSEQEESTPSTSTATPEPPPGT